LLCPLRYLEPCNESVERLPVGLTGNRFVNQVSDQRVEQHLHVGSVRRLDCDRFRVGIGHRFLLRIFAVAIKADREAFAPQDQAALLIALDPVSRSGSRLFCGGANRPR
jgi:hypothetical protein